MTIKQNIRSAAKASTALHHNYFGDDDFAKRVYEGQIKATISRAAVANINSARVALDAAPCKSTMIMPGTEMRFI